jgi:3-hydroxyacyl-CoA dehydrogenase
MKLVEVVRGLATSNEAFATVKALAEKLEKPPLR